MGVRGSRDSRGWWGPREWWGSRKCWWWWFRDGGVQGVRVVEVQGWWGSRCDGVWGLGVIGWGF